MDGGLERYNMKYIIMCGGPTCEVENPRHFTELTSQPLVERTVDLLKENGVEDICITTSGKGYEIFGVPVIKYNSNNNPYYWVDAFYLTEEPTCYIFGDVFFSRAAMKMIVETETDDIEFFASAPPFHASYAKRFAEPFAFKVVNTEHFKQAVEETKRLRDLGKFKREPISWELWQVIKGTPLNKIRYDNYTVLNDYSCDVDIPQDAQTLRTLIKTYGILEDEI